MQQGGYNRPIYEIRGVPRIIQERVELLQSKGVDKVLDFACGTGRISLYLAQYDFNVMAFDASPHAIKALKTKAADLDLTNIEVLKIDMWNLPADLGRFDLVIAWRVIHIGTEPERTRLRISINDLVLPNKYALIAAASSRCVTLDHRLAQHDVEEIEKNTLRYFSHGAIHIKHYYTLEELTRPGIFGDLVPVEHGHISEPSGHPEDARPRSYWWLLLHKR